MRPIAAGRALLGLVICVVVYASLYPFAFHSVASSFTTALFRTWRASLGVFLPGDFVANLLFYVPLGAAAYFAIDPAYPAAHRICAATLIALLLSTTLEMIQLFDSIRDSSLLDILTNSTGAFGGALLVAFAQRYSLLRKRIAPLFLLATWTAGVLLLMANRYAHITPVQWLPIVIEALVAGALLVECIRRGELRAFRFIAPLLVFVIVWRELAPFHFAFAQQRFEWIPFAGTFESRRGPGIQVFAAKLFVYDFSVWFLRRRTGSLIVSTALIGALLGVLEAIQIYVPGRVPEISDAVLAVLLGTVLYLLERISG